MSGLGVPGLMYEVEQLVNHEGSLFSPNRPGLTLGGTFAAATTRQGAS